MPRIKKLLIRHIRKKPNEIYFVACVFSFYTMKKTS
jgi:hypothetical protein